jgi:hypothetical protein
MDISSDNDSSQGDSALIIHTAGLFAMLEMELMEEDSGTNRAYNTRQSTCSRRSFDHHGSHNNILRDHLGPNALFGKELPLFFRLTRPRVEIIIQQLGNSIFRSESAITNQGISIWISTACLC